MDRLLHQFNVKIEINDLIKDNNKNNNERNNNRKNKTKNIKTLRICDEINENY